MEQTIQVNEPKPDDLCAFEEIIEGKPADPVDHAAAGHPQFG
ncbi:hypothetical protein [Bradyrhizobium sp.]